MKIAIIGLPRVGKSSLFTILTGTHQETRIGSLEARAGVAKVPDPRVDALAEVFRPGKVTHATIEFLDVPSISQEALRKPAYLASLRLVDALAHVLRAFADPSVPHEKGSIDPVRDMQEVETELILSDLVVVESRLERLEKDRKKIKSKELDEEYQLMERCRTALDKGRPLRELDFSAEEERRIRGFGFLSQKPMLLVLNVSEEDAPRLHEIEAEFRRQHLQNKRRTEVTAVCGKIEAELAELDPEEGREYLSSYGLTESGLDRLVRAAYGLMGMISFITAGDVEVRAWTVPAGTTALKAAGIVHSDFEKKFIRAEVADWRTLVECGGYAGARERGLLRLEGKDYVVQDGDVLLIRHG